MIRKRTPEEIRLIPAKGSDRTGDRKQRHSPAKPRKPGGTVKQNKRPGAKPPARSQAAVDASRPVYRVASTTKKSVMFTLDAPLGRDVAIAGSFNNWEPQAMTRGPDGLWRATIQMVHGTYEYKFLVDAEWREDPNNGRKTPNESGGYNSVCDVL